MRSRLILCIMLSVAVTLLRAQKLAVNVDGLWLASGIANIGSEVTFGKASTLSLALLGAKKPWVYRDLSAVALQPEWRYYLSQRPMYHHFVGVGAIIGNYSMTIDDDDYTGTAIGIGLTFGYVIALNKYLNIDLHSGFGLIHSQDRKRGHDNVTLPTKAGVSLTYILR